jgi:uncharacterized phage-associated protein
MIDLNMFIDELEYICFELNEEIKNLVHKEIFLDFDNYKIEVTQNALEKILYYLDGDIENVHLKQQITHQTTK